MQAVQFRIAEGGARGIVGSVHQDQLGISVRQSLDLIEIDAELVLLAHRVVANLDPKRFGERGKRRIAWPWQHHVGSRLRRQPHQNQQRLRSAGYHLHSLDIHSLHVGDSRA